MGDSKSKGMTGPFEATFSQEIRTLLQGLLYLSQRAYIIKHPDIISDCGGKYMFKS